MREFEANIVRNIRALYPNSQLVAQASDEALLKAWWAFSVSDEYHEAKENFPLWIE